MTHIVEIKKTNTTIQQKAVVFQSEDEAKQVDLNNRLVNLSNRVKVATRSIKNLEKDRMDLRLKFW